MLYMRWMSCLVCYKVIWSCLERIIFVGNFAHACKYISIAYTKKKNHFITYNQHQSFFKWAVKLHLNSLVPALKTIITICVCVRVAYIVTQRQLNLILRKIMVRCENAISNTRENSDRRFQLKLIDKHIRRLHHNEMWRQRAISNAFTLATANSCCHLNCCAEI